MKLFSIVLAVLLASPSQLAPTFSDESKSAVGTTLSGQPNSSVSAQPMSSLVLPSLVLSGRAVVGEVLSVVAGQTPSDAMLTYQWFSGDRLIPWISSNRYTLSGTDLGRKITVSVSAVRAGEPSVSTTLSTSGEVVAATPASPSLGSIPKTFTTFGVAERNATLQTIANFDVNIFHDQAVICSSSCRVSAQAGRSGLTGGSVFGINLMLKNSSGATVATQYLLLTSATPTADVSFNVSASLLSPGQAGVFYIVPDVNGLSSRQTFFPGEVSYIEIFRGPNTSRFKALDLSFDPSVRTFRQDTVRNSGGSILFSYALPASVDVTTECAPMVFFIAPISLIQGSPDGSANYAADFRLSVRNSSGVQVDFVSVTGIRGEWSTVASSYRLEAKICGLSTQLGRSQVLTSQLEFSYDAFDQNFSTTLNFPTTFNGGLRWSSINCFSGEAGLVVEAHEPKCPQGWTQTSAPVVGGKIRQTTINCLSGRDLQIIRAPEPQCPDGYAITRLPVKNGKLVPKRITCNRGEVVRVISDPFPQCPPGFNITTRPVRNGKLVPISITCTKGVLVTRVSAAFPRCPAGYTRR